MNKEALAELTARLSGPLSIEERERVGRLREIAAAGVLAETDPAGAAREVACALEYACAARQDHETVWAQVEAARIFDMAGQPGRAVEIARGALRVASGLLDIDDPLVRRAVEVSARAHAALGEADRASALYAALSELSQLDPPDRQAVAQVRAARVLAGAAPAVALEFASRAARALYVEFGGDDRRTVDAEVVAADCEARLGDLGAAVSRLLRAAEAAGVSPAANYVLETLSLLLVEAGFAQHAVAATAIAVAARAAEGEASLAGALTFHNAAIVVAGSARRSGGGYGRALAAYAVTLDAYALAGAPDHFVEAAGLEACEVARVCSPAEADRFGEAVRTGAAARTLATALRTIAAGQGYQGASPTSSA